MHQNFQTGRRPVARGLYPRRWRRSGWALGALSRQEPLMEPPRRSWLPVPSNCPVSLRPLLHTASRSLSPHCALSIQVSPGSVGCGCSSLQEGSPLLITNAKVIRSSRLVSISPQFKNTKKKEIILFDILGILSALFQVIPIRGCALIPANSVLHRRKRSMSLAWTFQRAAPTPLTAIALVFLGVLDNIDTRSR